MGDGSMEMAVYRIEDRGGAKTAVLATSLDDALCVYRGRLAGIGKEFVSGSAWEPASVSWVMKVDAVSSTIAGPTATVTDLDAPTLRPMTAQEREAGPF